MTTVTQDPAGRYTLLAEKVRRIGEEQGPRHGFGRLVHLLICDIFLCMLRAFAALAERARAGTLPEVAPAPSQDAAPRSVSETDISGDQPCAPSQQPEMLALRAAAPRPARMKPCRTPRVEPPPRACVRPAKDRARPTPAHPHHVDDGTWPRWRGPGLFCGRRVFEVLPEKTGFGRAAVVCQKRFDLATN